MIIADPDIDLTGWTIWELGRRGKSYRYAARRLNGKTVYLHRVIMNAQPGDVVDHINKNTLDNRRRNLRIGGERENQLNSVKQETPNVGWHRGRWRCRLRWPDGRRIEKTFKDYDEAVEWYWEKHRERTALVYDN
jgi:hypothetical protein